MKCFRKAAEKEHAEAQFELAICYWYGEGVSKDGTETVKWCRKAAEQGHAQAQFWLGKGYYFGDIGVSSKDYTEAVKWFRKAAEQGDEMAKRRLEEWNL
ncbi:MAG: sel1 repeat family protein [Lentisphaeria bacterium]|nr:sel1 repeat family protein [Lentisphaeria bacterium]